MYNFNLNEPQKVSSIEYFYCEIHLNLVKSVLHDFFTSSCKTTADIGEPSLWEHYINQKDLGVKCLWDGFYCKPSYGRIKFNKYTYKIVDEKKWLLSKLKYSI